MARKLQFSASYKPLEDRLLLSGTFPDGTEIELMFTRRMTRRLLKGIDAFAERMVEREAGAASAAAVAQPEVRRQVASFKREAAVDSANFDEPYRKGETHPLIAETTRLVTQVKLTPREGERIGLTFKLEQGQQVSFDLPQAGLWSLAHMLAQQAQRCEWDLGEMAPPPAAAAERGRLN